MVHRISSKVWPIVAIPASSGNDQSPAEDSEKKRPEHEAVARTSIESEEGRTDISPEGRAVLKAEEEGAQVKWEPPALDPRIAAYLNPKQP